MTQLVWHQSGQRFYETGVDRGVFYPRIGPGVAWNGLIAVNENSSGGDVEELYFDGIKYLDNLSSETFTATIEAYSAPSEFASYDGSKAIIPGVFASQQRRKSFGLSYRTLIGNDLDGTDYGYKIHLVYNATVSPASRSNQSMGGNVNPRTQQWSITTVPVPSILYKPTAHIVVNSTMVDPDMLEDLERYLYGRNTDEPSLISDPLLPSPSKLIEILGNRITEPLTEPI